MSKTMTQTVRGHNLKVTVAMVLIAVLVLLVVALAYMMQPAVTTGASNPGIHATSGAVGSSITHDPYIDRHAEVVARYHQGSLR
jgi:hypothetical protein